MLSRRIHRWLLLVALAALALFATACSLRLSQIEVDNQSSSNIFVADSQLSCKDQPKLSDLHTHELAPGESRKVFVATGSFENDSCIFVGDNQGHIALSEIQHNGVYSVTSNGALLQIDSTGQEAGGIDFSLNGPPMLVLLILGIPFALGGLFALWITFSFFYGYYVQGKR